MFKCVITIQDLFLKFVIMEYHNSSAKNQESAQYADRK